MSEFRYTGLNPQQKRITGYLEAKNKTEAKQRIALISRQKGFTLSSVQKKSTYLYKVSRQGGSPIRGEQQAYSKEEVELALRRMGFDNVHVEKSLIDIRMKPPQGDIITFIRLSADLLREKLPFDEILSLLETDINNKSMKKVIKEILSDLKDGKDGEEVFSKQEYFLGKFPAKMLGVASKSGNMAEVYENTAIFLERVHDFKKSIRSALLMPSITMLVLLAAVIFYIGYIFPATAEMFASFGAELPPMTDFSLKMSHFLTGNISWIIALMVVPPLILLRLATTKKGQIVTGQFAIKAPILGPIMHKTSIEIFCRVFNSMYSGSGENIEVIRTAAEACNNKFMEKQIKEVTIPMMVREGKGFVESLKAADVFTDNALTRFNTGAESGTLKKVSLQIARYYEKESKYKMQAIVDWIQVFVSMIIMIVMTLLTVVSSETAVFSPKMPGMGM